MCEPVSLKKADKARKVRELACCEDEAKLPQDPFAVVVFGSRMEVSCRLKELHKQRPDLAKKPHIITAWRHHAVDNIGDVAALDGVTESLLYLDRCARNTDDMATYAVKKLRELNVGRRNIVYLAFPVLARGGLDALIHHGLSEEQIHAAFPASLLDLEGDVTIRDDWVEGKYNDMKKGAWKGKKPFVVTRPRNRSAGSSAGSSAAMPLLA